MKVVILAGGRGTRLAEETGVRPKPMVEVGNRPILWHIMKIYSAHGFHDFVICLGYRGFMIKEYFSNYFLHMSDVTFHMKENRMEIQQQSAEPWRVTLVETGEETQTGGRIKRVSKYLEGENEFALTYGDGLADIDLTAEKEFHKKHGKLATIGAVQPAKRFGALSLSGDKVTSFAEKPNYEGGWINGGFFILSTRVLDYIKGDDTAWEREPLERLAQEDQLRAFTHRGFWQPMDTLREKIMLEEMWDSGQAPWKKWA